MNSTASKDIKRIAIIGGGPSGIATAKYLIAEDHFTKIDIFEQQASTGGVWIYSSDEPKSKPDIPQTNPIQRLEEPKWHPKCGGKLEHGSVAQEPAFESPMYDGLETNIPRDLMQFSDKPFPENEQLFPVLDSVLHYLDEHAKDVEHLIQFSIQVLTVSQKITDGETEWLVRTQNLLSNTVTERSYDAVVVATGHYKVPFIPDIKGIREWNDVYPNTISHSKFYKHPKPYSNQKTLIIGYSASGLDISAQISILAQHPVLISRRSASPFSSSFPPWAKPLPEIAEFLPNQQRSVRFTDGHVETNLDAVLFCTGYLYSFPFLSALPAPVITDGQRVRNLYQHFLYHPLPTLAFLGLPFPIIPFRTAEAQAAVLARLWSGRLALPPESEMQAWEQQRVEETGDGKKFHALPFPDDFDYANGLCAWAMRAETEAEGVGKAPRQWSHKERWTRGRFAAIRRAFKETGEARGRVRRMEELGFVYEDRLEG